MEKSQNHTLTIFWYELSRNFRRRGFLFTTFGLPILLFVLVNLIQAFAAQSGSDLSDPNTANALIEEFTPDDNLRAGVVDLSGLFSDPAQQVEWLTPYADEAAARSALEADEIDVYYLINENYLEAGDVTTVLPQLKIAEIGSISGVSAFIRRVLSEGIDPTLERRLLDPANYQETNLALLGAEDAAAPQSEDTSFVIVYLFAVTLLVTLFMTNGYLMQTLIEEKETRLIEILISTLRPIQLLTGKILALGLLGLLQIVVWIGGVYLFAAITAGQQFTETLSFFSGIAQLRLPTTLLPVLFAYFVLAYLLFAGFYSIISALSNSMREGPQWAVIFVLPATLPLYFLPIFASSPDSGLPVILSLFPLTAPLSMISRLVVSEVPAWQVALSLALLAAAVVFTIWLASRIFRVGILLAGQPPKFRDLGKLIRE